MLVQVYGNNAMKKTAVYKWVTRFSEGRESFTGQERSGWPAVSRTEENIVKVCQIVRENRQLTFRSIAEQALLPKIKQILKGRQYDDINNIRINTAAALKVVPQNQRQNCFEGWTRRWHWCIASQGEYFEGDHSDIQQ
ncbi:hypothetical protein B7P43_G11748 [Cryptotermes secundus]|uniref:Mos1 transposase HTH domain-containing protein n=1 Tax=Cryptotermes secundus TaxID=105785 RepID=A0A2J7QB35_9NEOP|nr:hypothetical protein B7P43_G11748 [Cryptotermes secundus]